MTLGQLVNLEQEKLAGEHHKLLEEITEYRRILSDRQNILDIIREDCRELKRKHADLRRTEISGEEIGEIDMEDLITEETMVVSITSNGYIKRTPSSVYRAQRRGGKGLTGAKTEDEDPVQHLFVASTHAYLMFFTNKGKVYWRKVYDLPQLARDSRGRAVVNLLNLGEGEQITDCRAVRDFDHPDYFLVMATARGLVKKTPLVAYSRPMKNGIIAIKLREGDALVDVVVAKPGDELLLATAGGMAIRFKQSDARAVGRNSSGVKGIRLVGNDSVVGMVVADPEATLLTVCVNGYGKRTPLGPNMELTADESLPEHGEHDEHDDDAADADVPEPDVPDSDEPEEGEGGEESSQRSYRTQRRGGKGLRDIKTTDRNGPVVGIVHCFRRRRAIDDDRPRQASAHCRQRREHHRPQHARREDHEPRRRRHAGGRQARAERRGEGGGSGEGRGGIIVCSKMPRKRKSPRLQMPIGKGTFVNQHLRRWWPARSRGIAWRITWTTKPSVC